MKNIMGAIAVMAVTSLSLAASDDADFCKDTLKNVMAKEKIQALSTAVDQNGKILFKHSACDGKKVKTINDETPLHVASITKIFTSALMLKLAEEGKVSIYDNVRRYIPEFPLDDILIHHLMTHTSGCRVGGNLKNKKQMYEKTFRQFPCNTNFAYSSACYNVLGDIIERITGMPLEVYAKKTIFDKLDMKNSSLSPNMGESGMNTTALDLLKFARHILDIRKSGKAGVFKPFTVDLMFREHTAGRYDRTPVFFLKSQTRSFGNYYADLNSPETAGHAGSTGCFLLLDPKNDLAIAFLTNGSKSIQADDANFIKINNMLMGRFAK